MNAKMVLRKTIIELLEESTIDNITVDMILQRSGVARATFYKYFRDKRDLMMYVYRSFMQANFDYSNYISHEDLCVRTLEFMKNNRKFFTNAFKSEGQNSCVEAIHDDSVKFLERVYIMNRRVATLTTEEKNSFRILRCGGGCYHEAMG